MLYAVVGTVVNFAVTFGIIYYVNSFDLIRLNFKGVEYHMLSSTILFFAAAMCSTDSVAALTMIKAEEFPKLFSIIFGESLLNDAVAIILF